MNCKKCAFRDDCQYADAVEFCDEYEPSDDAIREEREAWEIDKADAKRKGLQ